MKTIPKIIHQTWKTKDIPDKWKAFAQSWRDHHPEWEYILWTDASGRDFVAQNYSDFLSIYDSYAHNIERADVIRYLILQKIGGVYVDLDSECLKPLDDLLPHYSCMLAREPIQHAQRYGKKSLASNAFMASCPNHTFWTYVKDELLKVAPNAVKELNTIHRTGPILLHNAWENYRTAGQKELELLTSNIFYQLSFGSEVHLKHRVNRMISSKFKRNLLTKGTYAIHYFDTTWGPIQTETLTNPHPTEIEGFTFHPGLRFFNVHDKSESNITRYMGRNIPELAKKTLQDRAFVGFDTNGFATTNIWHVTLPNKMITFQENEGIYIRNNYKVSAKIKMASFYQIYFHSMLSVINYRKWPESIRKPIHQILIKIKPKN